MGRIMAAVIVAALLLLAFASTVHPQGRNRPSGLDEKVRAFLDSRKGEWRDLNVPESDGRMLHDLIVKNGFRRALEIGTSTGHSAIWIAWALSKTGGRLITVEIDEARHRQALENFREAGLSDYIDARLADAHELVPGLPGPFDFVFSDADKEWYRNYFDAVAPKLSAGGCFATHNVSEHGSDRFGLRGYVDYIKGRRDFETSFDERGAGISVSCKKS